MKNKINKVFWKDSWTIMSFPRQGTSIVYDAKNKKYNFHEGIPTKDKEIKKSVIKNDKGSRLGVRHFMAILLAGALGISLAVNLLQWILKQ